MQADPKPPFRQKWNSSAGTLTQETNRKIQELKDNLEAQKDQELTSLRHRTEQQLEDLDTYYRQNHQQLAEDLFQQLLRY